MVDMGIRHGSEYWAEPLRVEKDTVYVHTDITQVEDEDGNPMWEYHEYQYTLKEYYERLGIDSNNASDSIDALMDTTLEQEDVVDELMTTVITMQEKINELQGKVGV
jgi:hypothetical protein